MKMVKREENEGRRIGARTSAEKGKQIKLLRKRTCRTCLIQQENMQYALLRQKTVGEVTYFIWREKVLLMTKRSCDFVAISAIHNVVQVHPCLCVCSMYGPLYSLPDGSECNTSQASGLDTVFYYMFGQLHHNGDLILNGASVFYHN